MRSSDSIDDFGDCRSWHRRVNLAVFIGLVAVVEIVGTPQVRLSRSERVGQYAGVEGMRMLRANDAGAVPLIVFAPMKRPLHEYVLSLFSDPPKADAPRAPRSFPPPKGPVPYYVLPQ